MRPCEANDLKARTPKEWVAAIKQLRGHGMRSRVACIVGWDFAFDHKDYLGELQHWIDGYYEEASVEMPDELVMEGLRKVGYPEALIAKKFNKRTQPLNQGKRVNQGVIKRRDCHTKRAKHWSLKEKHTRIA